MSQITIDFSSIPPFAKAMREAAPKHLMKATARAFYKIGRSDVDKMKADQLVAGRLHIRSKGFANSFKSRATDSRQAKSIDDIQLSEYTGAKPMRIFQTGGDISPVRSRLLTILAPGARSAGGRRKFSMQELRAMINNGQAKIIQTRFGAMIMQTDARILKGGNFRGATKSIILAWLRPAAHEQKRIDFYKNFDANDAAHRQLLGEAAQEAIEKTIAL